MIPLLFASALATTLERPLSLEELVARSDAAVLGQVADTEVVLRNGRIWTVLHVDAEVGRDTEVWVHGGCLENGVCMDVIGAPRAKKGERVFVFLTGDKVTGLAQGLFHVRDEDGSRELSGLTFREAGTVPVRVALVDLLVTADPLLGD